MCKAIEDMITDEKKVTAVRLLKREKMTLEEIAEDVNLPLSVIEELAGEL